jgi:hypothetical protein
MKRAPSPRAEAVFRRFFLAFDGLHRAGLLPSLSKWSQDSGFSPSQFRELRRLYGPGEPPPSSPARYNAVDMDAILLLADAGVAAEWLLAGRGPMMADGRNAL